MWKRKGKGCIKNAVPTTRIEQLEEVCMTKFMVAFWHGGSLIERFWHERNINREFVLRFFRDRFPHIFSQGNNQKGKLFLQHNTPPRIERYSRKLWIIILAEYLRYPSVAWSKAHRKHISFCRRVSRERYHQEKDKKRDLWTLLYSCY